jgi:hypothetical protein
MITFKQQITVPKELVQGLALDLGWTPKLTRQVEIVDDDTTEPITVHSEDEEYPNPVSAEEYIDQKAKEHTQNFFLPFGEKLVEQAVASAQAQVEHAKEMAQEQIIEPILQALTTEIVTSEK